MNDKKVETTDGMMCDKKSNLYLGNIENSRTMKIDPDMSLFIKDDRLIWPDSYSISDDGYLYKLFTNSKAAKYNTSEHLLLTSYTIYRINYRNRLQIEWLCNTSITHITKKITASCETVIL